MLWAMGHGDVGHGSLAVLSAVGVLLWVMGSRASGDGLEVAVDCLPFSVPLREEHWHSTWFAGGWGSRFVGG